MSHFDSNESKSQNDSAVLPSSRVFLPEFSKLCLSQIRKVEAEILVILINTEEKKKEEKKKKKKKKWRS